MVELPGGEYQWSGGSVNLTPQQLTTINRARRGDPSAFDWAVRAGLLGLVTGSTPLQGTRQNIPVIRGGGASGRGQQHLGQIRGSGAFGGISSGGNQSQLSVAVGSGASLPLTRQQRAAATSAARAAAVRAARKVTPATVTSLPRGAKGPGFTPFKGTDFNIRDNLYKAARSGRLRTVNDIKRAASNIENPTFRAKVIVKAQRLALAAIRAGR